MQWLSVEKELYLFLKCSYFPLLMKMTPQYSKENVWEI